MNKIYYIVSFIIGVNFNIHSQQNVNFERIDSIARKVKYDSQIFLAEDITKHCNNELEKVRAIFIWISENIAYDYELMNDIKLKNKIYVSKSTLVDKTLETKKAICSGYATLFKELCDDLDIESVIVEGISKQWLDDLKEKSNSDHAWNAVKIDEQWYLLDVTWSRNYKNYNKKDTIYNDFWFLTNPKYFFYSHFPLTDNKWTLLNEIKTKTDFYNLPNIHNYMYFNGDFKMVSQKNEVLEIKDGIITVEFEVENINSEFDFIGTPWNTYASLNNLPKPTEKEWKENSEKYSLLIPSIKVIDKKVIENRIIYRIKVLASNLKGIIISFNNMQICDYKVVKK